MLEAGRCIAGRYLLQHAIGAGGMGSVWKALHVELDAPVAVKFQHHRPEHSQRSLQRFRREARAAAKLRSPHVVRIVDFGVDHDLPFLVMELLEGESLQALLDRRARPCIEKAVNS